MRVMRVIDNIKTPISAANFMALAFEVVAIIRVEHPITSRWGLSVIAIEVLEHLNELDGLAHLFDSSVEYVLGTYDNKRVCECVAF